MWGKKFFPAVWYSLVRWDREILLNYIAGTSLGNAIAVRAEAYRTLQASNAGLERLLEACNRELAEQEQIAAQSKLSTDILREEMLAAREDHVREVRELRATADEAKHNLADLAETTK
jgi:hypothetical protein